MDTTQQETGMLVVKEEPRRLIIEEAPDRIRIGLAFIQLCDREAVRIGYNSITFYAENFPLGLTYRIVGWDDALVCEKNDA